VGNLPDTGSHYAARAQVQHRLADDRLMTSIIRSRKPRKSAKKRMLIIDGIRLSYANLTGSSQIESG
jgi:hypothetical protein